MNSDLFSLPLLPFEATRGVLAPDWLTTTHLRRRYAHIVACALVGRPSWAIEKWVDDGIREEHCPRFLRARAVAEGWPMVVHMRYGISVRILMRPALLPESFDALLEDAVLRLPEDVRLLGRETLRAFWDGTYPEGDLSALDAAFGKAIYSAARAGIAAQQATFDAVVAEVQPAALQA